MPKFVLMISLVDHIEYLISSHECVVIPGLGALIVRQEPSIFDEDSSYFKKPANEITFNGQIVHNDGLLVNSVAKREGMTYEQALAFVEDNVSLYKRLLAKGDDVALGHIGYLKEINSRVEFVPCVSIDNLDEFFGLNSYKFVPLTQVQTCPDVLDEEHDEQVVVAVKQHNMFANAFRAAASIVLLVCLTVLLTTPVLNDRNQAYASLEMPKVTFAEESVWGASMKSDLQIAKPESAVMLSTAPEQDQMGTSPEAKYQLIVASLTTEKQAQKYIDTHKDSGIDLQIVKKRKVFYVSAGKSDNYGKLLSLKKKLGNDYSDAWILY